MDNAFVERLLKLMAKYDACDEICWDENLNFYVNSSDIFCWGTSDLEQVTPDNIDMLERAYKDIGWIYGSTLFCARLNKMRPQGAVYPHDKTLWKWFDMCGPEREIGIGNPYKPGEYDPKNQ